MTQLADELERHLPYLRRYARALTGQQDLGDDLAFGALQSLSKNRAQIKNTDLIKLDLFRAFHRSWMANDNARARARSGRTPTPEKNSREALLLATLEGFDRDSIGYVLEATPGAVADLLRQAATDMLRGKPSEVMIIEDDAIIATDLKTIVEKNDHKVVAMARTQAEAVTMAKVSRPELILADIQLADGSSGIDAVRQILNDFGHLPIIFVTAFPERLLTGQRPEPAFLITKPYRNEQIASAVSQAMFFASTHTLVAD